MVLSPAAVASPELFELATVMPMTTAMITTTTAAMMAMSGPRFLGGATRGV
jgi:hypothetical protein